jgi:hypothetical protein
MAAHALKRQFIRDSEGNPIGVILPLEEFALVEETLTKLLLAPSNAGKLAQMEKAVNDDLFMADLCETMNAFEQVDAQWSEPD